MAEWYAVGVGLASAAEPAEVTALVDGVLRTAGIARDAVRVVATIDTRADHPALDALASTHGWPVVTFSASRLAAAGGAAEDRVPVAVSGSPPRREAQGRTSVAEPAALLAAGPDATLVVPKRRSPRATVAVARVRTEPSS